MHKRPDTKYMRWFKLHKVNKLLTYLDIMPSKLIMTDLCSRKEPFVVYY